MRIWGRWILLVGLLVLLAGCTSKPSVSPQPIGKIAKTQHWQTVLFNDPGVSNLPNGYGDSAFTDPKTGWMLTLHPQTSSLNYLSRTLDGGHTWVKTSHPFSSFTVVNANVAWAVGDSASGASRLSVYRTTDGGASWTSKPLPGYDMFDIACAVSDKEAWAKGHKANISTTKSGFMTRNTTKTAYRSATTPPQIGSIPPMAAPLGRRSASRSPIHRSRPTICTSMTGCMAGFIPC